MANQTDAIPVTVEQAAKELARSNGESVESMLRIYWFPHESEVRLVEVDELTLLEEGEQVRPFYFSAVPALPFTSGIALIRPEEERAIGLPEDWGGWERARLVWSKAA